MKDTVKNSLVKIFYFIVSVMEAVKVLNGSNSYFIFFKNKITLIAM